MRHAIISVTRLVCQCSVHLFDSPNCEIIICIRQRVAQSSICMHWHISARLDDPLRITCQRCEALHFALHYAFNVAVRIAVLHWRYSQVTPLHLSLLRIGTVSAPFPHRFQHMRQLAASVSHRDDNLAACEWAHWRPVHCSRTCVS